MAALNSKYEQLDQNKIKSNQCSSTTSFFGIKIAAKMNSHDVSRRTTDCQLLQQNFPNVYNMTSREFHTDTIARIGSVSSRLKDKVTNQIFEEAIRYNRHLFKDKIILALNCGSDLLFPLWAAKYGASHVYAVDVSHAVDYLRAIIVANNMSERITVIQGRVQDIDLPVKEVDVILSNWMGYAILIETKIKSVIYAREKWLKKSNGVIFPDVAKLYVVGVQNSTHKSRRVDWWRNVHSFNMDVIRKTALTEPVVQRIDPNEILTMPVKVWTINLKKLKYNELGFQDSFFVEILSPGLLEGFVTFFDVHFSKSHVPVSFSTSPWASYTNWLQTVFYFDDPFAVNIGERYYSDMSMKKVLLKDGSYATKTDLKMFSLVEGNLSLMFKMKWSIKSLFTDQTDGIPNGVQINELTNSNKSQSKSSSGKSSPDSQSFLQKSKINSSIITEFNKLNITSNLNSCSTENPKTLCKFIENNNNGLHSTTSNLIIKEKSNLNANYIESEKIATSSMLQIIPSQKTKKHRNYKHTKINCNPTVEKCQLKLNTTNNFLNETHCDKSKSITELESQRRALSVPNGILLDKKTEFTLSNTKILPKNLKNTNKNIAKAKKSKSKLSPKNTNKILSSFEHINEPITNGDSQSKKSEKKKNNNTSKNI